MSLLNNFALLNLTYCNNQLFTVYNTDKGSAEVFAILGSYAACVVSYLPTFRDSLSTPS